MLTAWAQPQAAGSSASVKTLLVHTAWERLSTFCLPSSPVPFLFLRMPLLMAVSDQYSEPAGTDRCTKTKCSRNPCTCRGKARFVFACLIFASNKRHWVCHLVQWKSVFCFSWGCCHWSTNLPGAANYFTIYSSSNVALSKYLFLNNNNNNTGTTYAMFF